MSGPIDDGGPAFPCSNDENVNYNYCKQGMTLRDWFAGQALGKCLHEYWGENDGLESSAVAAYAIADAMLAAREEAK
jgi:hypothetical protein